ncbi:MAG TPA: TolC family protein [Fimbriimonadaceae bacterium]|nr:TolC family protein [Fimbriimonadaceae bacterium]
MRSTKCFNLGASLLLVASAAAQDSLTLNEALMMARERNGDVRAAELGVSAARARVSQQFAAFLPTVTPTYRYNTSRRESTVDGSTSVFNEQGSQTGVSADWTLLDSGERDWSWRSSRRLAEAERHLALQTLRTILFSVHERFYDALRTQELQRVADLQVERAETILRQTETQVEVGAAPKKDILQARADLLNARVQALQIRNQTVTTEAQLKAIIGWEPHLPLPPLQAATAPEVFELPPPMEQGKQVALRRRPDLLAQRERIESQRYSVLRAQRQALFGWSVGVSYDRLFTPNTAEGRSVSLVLSVPLFDGGRARAAEREARLNLEASRNVLAQSEREIEAEIEAAYTTHSQNVERVQAAQLALEAARLNYQAAVESQGAGAEGTNIVTVLTAQVSLVTAESNYIEALYDYFVSDVRLKLATGETIPGELE